MKSNRGFEQTMARQQFVRDIITGTAAQQQLNRNITWLAREAAVRTTNAETSDLYRIADPDTAEAARKMTLENINNILLEGDQKYLEHISRLP